MSKERELLRRALEEWDSDNASYPKFASAMDEIRTHLAAEEGKQEEEPFPIVQSGCIRGLQLSGKPYPRTCPACGLGPCKISLHPSPQAKQRKPLSGDEIVKAYNQTPVTARVACFEAGVRFAEKHHGISEDP